VTPNVLQDLPVLLKSLLHAKVADIPVQRDDTVRVPGSRLKTAVNVRNLS
jgi:hypothetical protein